MMPKILLNVKKDIMIFQLYTSIDKINFDKTKNVSILRLNQLVMSYAGKNLRYLRKLRGYTQEEFANNLGVKRSLI